MACISILHTSYKTFLHTYFYMKLTFAIPSLAQNAMYVHQSGIKGTLKFGGKIQGKIHSWLKPATFDLPLNANRNLPGKQDVFS